MSSQGEIGIVAAGSGSPCSRDPQKRRNRQAAARRIAGQRDVPRLDPLIQQPLVRLRHIVDRARMHILRRQPIVHDQRATADRLGEVSIHLAMREHRAGDVTAAMRAQQHPVLRAAFRHRPQRRNPAGIGLDIIDPARLRRYVTPMFEHRPHLVERHLRVGRQCRRSSFCRCVTSCSLCLLAIVPGISAVQARRS